MREQRKYLREIMSMLALVFLLAIVSKVNVNAATPTSDGFTVHHISTDRTVVGIDLPNNHIMKQAELIDAQGNILKSQKCVKFVVFTGLSANNVYRCRYRTLIRDYTLDKYVVSSDWSEMIGFIPTTYTMKQVGSKRAFTIDMPKVYGVAKYKVYMSKKQNTGYVAVKKAKPGKTVKISKFKGKKLKKNTYYYVRIYPILINKMVCYPNTSRIIFKKN